MKSTTLAIFFLLFSTFSNAQKIFNIYDGFTLELVDSVKITSSKSTITNRKITDGIYAVSNTKEGTNITFSSPGYLPKSFKCLNDKNASYSIILTPSDSLLKVQQSPYSFYKGSGKPSKGTPLFTAGKESNQNDSIYTVVDKAAQFPGGQNALMMYLSKNIQYPQSAIELNISGKVYLQFVVNKEGEISTIQIMKGVCLPIDKEAYKVIREMPKWEPGYHKDNPVNSTFNLPINFKLQ